MCRVKVPLQSQIQSIKDGHFRSEESIASDLEDDRPLLKQQQGADTGFYNNRFQVTATNVSHTNTKQGQYNLV